METGEIMTVTDVSRVLQVSSRQVYRLMAEGHLRYSRLGPGGDAEYEPLMYRRCCPKTASSQKQKGSKY